MSHQPLSCDGARPLQIVDHIFECIAQLRAAVKSDAVDAHEAYLGGEVVNTLTADVSNLFRDTACGTYPPVNCPAHGELEVVTVLSLRHKELLDTVFRGGASGIICRHCQRESVLYDLKFNYCNTCRYLRCMFCVPRGAMHWKTLRCLLEANPKSAGTLFPGSRLLLHEVVALVPAKGSLGEDDALAVVKLLLKLHPEGARSADGLGDLPLHWACCGQSVACIQLLIDAFPDGLKWPNSKGGLPLHVACRGDCTEIVTVLLNSVPSPSGLDKFNANGNLPLHIAVSQQNIVSSIVLACLDKFPDGIRLANKRTKHLPLHQALSNRDHPDMGVIRSLLQSYPASALLSVGEEAELPLHLVLSRPLPSLPAVAALLDIAPESALTPSHETAWSSAETPLELAKRKEAAAIAAAEQTNDALAVQAKKEQAAVFRSAMRIMLSRNKKHDPPLLRTLNWEERKQGVMMLQRKQGVLGKFIEGDNLALAKHIVSFI